MARLLAVCVVVWGLPALAQQKEPAKPPDQPDKKAEAKDQSPEQQYAALIKQFQLERSAFYRKSRDLVKQYQAAKTDTEKKNILKQYTELSRDNPANSYVDKFLQLAQAHPDSHVASQALLWVIQNARGNAAMTKTVLAELEKNYADAKGIEEAFPSLVYIPGADPEPLFRKVIETHPDRKAKALAAYFLASYLNRQSQYGQGNEHAQEEAVALLKRVDNEFPDVKYRGKTLKEVIEPLLFELTRLQIGMEVPEIAGEDVDGAAFKISDYRGKVVVIDFWGDW